MPRTVDQLRADLARERDLRDRASGIEREVCEEMIALLERALVEAQASKVECENVTE